MKINLQAPLNALGYGVASTNILLALDNLGVEVALWPIGQVGMLDHSHVQVIQRAIDRQASFDKYAPSVRLWHQFDLAQHVGSGCRIGFPIFELNKFTEREKLHLRSQDKICVCSEWAKDIVMDEVVYPELEKCEHHERYMSLREEALMDKVHVVPLGVDRALFNENVKSTYRKTARTTFIAVGKWEVRKGHDIIIKAFERAFTVDDKVQLFMLTENPFLSPEKAQEWYNLYKRSPMADSISILPRQNTQSDVANIMMVADCGLFPARGEGWNLELLEMMSMGKQVIATNYSAHTEFCTKDNCMRIDINKTESAYDGIWFNGQGNWAHLGDSQIDQLASHMQEVHRQRQAGTLPVNEEGIKTAKYYSWENAAKCLLEACK